MHYNKVPYPQELKNIIDNEIEKNVQEIAELNKKDIEPYIKGMLHLNKAIKDENKDKKEMRFEVEKIKNDLKRIQRNEKMKQDELLEYIINPGPKLELNPKNTVIRNTRKIKLKLPETPKIIRTKLKDNNYLLANGRASKELSTQTKMVYDFTSNKQTCDYIDIYRLKERYPEFFKKTPML